MTGQSLATGCDPASWHGSPDGNHLPGEAFWAIPPDAELAALGTGPAGLTGAEASARLESVMPLGTHRSTPASAVFLRQFTSPITLILIGATVISAALGDTTDATTILAIVLLSGLLSFRQEFASSQAVAQLLASVQVSSEVVRDGATVSVPAEQVVPGDIVSLAIGDLVPGDCRILEANGLVVDESSLTGESMPVDKAPGVLPADTPLAQRTNGLFLGTHVVRGTGRVVVVAAGTATQFGRVSKGVANRRPATGFEQGLSRFGTMLFRIMIVIAAVIFAANVMLGRPWIDSVLFSVALAVGLTPQLMPAIVNVSLAMGARQMARAKVIVKRLNAIEDFGQMDVLCSDKTGTLTVGTVEFAGAFDPSGVASQAVMHAALDNARYQAGYRNPIDDAIVAACATSDGAAEGRCSLRLRAQTPERAGGGAGCAHPDREGCDRADPWDLHRCCRGGLPDADRRRAGWHSPAFRGDERRGAADPRHRHEDDAHRCAAYAGR
ncbi:MAG: HAD-IC family P-type ATPase [Thermomicrobiales bacterium]